MMKNNILIITGGTGGHVIPALNFFNYINNDSQNVFLLTDKRGYKYVKNINKSKVLKIQSSHLSGNLHFKFIGLIKLLIGFVQSFIIFLKIRPKIIISFGSYASLAPLICFMVFKFFFKTKLYIHEQNSIIGQTNKIFSKPTLSFSNVKYFFALSTISFKSEYSFDLSAKSFLSILPDDKSFSKIECLLINSLIVFCGIILVIF